jgi:guanylate kinase
VTTHKSSSTRHRPNPLLFVISGPSGAGKDSVLTLLKKTVTNMQFITTMTTRKPRPQEIEGVDYRFVSLETFEDLKKKNELLECAQVYGNWYGPPKEAIRQALKEGKDAILRVDVQGVKNIKKIVPDAVFIFIMTPTLKELEKRLKKRYTETEAELALRLKTAADEIKQVKMFDYVVFNNGGSLQAAVDKIKAIIIAEKCRVKPRKIRLL